MRNKYLAFMLSLVCAALVFGSVACGGGGGSDGGSTPIPFTARAQAQETATPLPESMQDRFQLADNPTPVPTPTPLSDYQQWDAPPPMTIDPSKSYTAIIELEKGGTIEIELYADKVPNTVNNFVFLANEGFYNGTTFYRVIQNVIAQGGDPTRKGIGGGGPGYRIDDEFHADLRHDAPGIVSMVNRGQVDGKGTNASQFFIIFRAEPRYDGLKPDGTPTNCKGAATQTINVGSGMTACYPVFGKVVKGLQLARGLEPHKIEQMRQRPQDVITTITIREE